MKKYNSLIKNEFIKYLEENGGNVDYLKYATKKYKLEIFDVFFYGVKYVRNNIDNDVFKNYVSKKLKENTNRIWMDNNTYYGLKDLFTYFIKFCEQNNKFFDLFFLEKYGGKIDNYLSGDLKELLKNWHDCIINNDGENGDKIRNKLLCVYNKIGIDNYDKLLSFYSCFFQAYNKFSKINSKNKKKEEGEKQDAFDISFKFLCEELLKSGLKLEEGIIKSLFGKYLNFVPKYRDKIGQTLRSELVKNLNKLKEDVKGEIGENFGESIVRKWSIPGNYSIEGDGFGPIVVVSSDENGDLTERGDFVAHINKGIFPEEKFEEDGDENVVKEKKHPKKRKKKSNQMEIDF